MKLALIIPAYNEELTIGQVISDFHHAIPEAQIFVIDNNSSDMTQEVALKALESNQVKGEVIFEEKIGKANAINKALREVEADIFIMVDADSTYEANDVHKLLEPVLKNNADIVIGNRFALDNYKNVTKRRFHLFGNNLVKRLINFLYNTSLNDIMTGYRVMNKLFVRTYPILISGFELETDMTLHALDKNFRLIELPIIYKERPVGSISKLNTFSDGLRVIKTIIRIFKNLKPMLFFGLACLIFFLFGIASGIPVIIDYMEDFYVERVPLAILASGLMIISLLCLSIGLILDTIVKLHKFDFELKINRYKNPKSEK